MSEIEQSSPEKGVSVTPRRSGRERKQTMDSYEYFQLVDVWAQKKKTPTYVSKVNQSSSLNSPQNSKEIISKRKSLHNLSVRPIMYSPSKNLTPASVTRRRKFNIPSTPTSTLTDSDYEPEVASTPIMTTRKRQSPVEHNQNESPAHKKRSPAESESPMLKLKEKLKPTRKSPRKNKLKEIDKPSPKLTLRRTSSKTSSDDPDYPGETHEYEVVSSVILNKKVTRTHSSNSKGNGTPISLTRGRPRRIFETTPQTTPVKLINQMTETLASTPTRERCTRLGTSVKRETPSSAKINISKPDQEIKETPAKRRVKTLQIPETPPKSTVPSVECTVPCREVEFQKIWSFIKSNLEASESSCIYVSGVPGTGKTLVVKAVINTLDDLAEKSNGLNFKHVYINGLSLGAPQKIYNRFYNAISTKKLKMSSAKALIELEKFFKGKHVPVVLIVDELDQLLDREQSILYQLLEWSSNNSSLLSFIAIFNTINLPEKLLAMRNVSRMGLDRVVFTAYTHDQLGTILQGYLGVEKTERLGEAIVLISRKVAAVSGDARRALEISKRALEIMTLKNITGIMAVKETFKELFSAPKIQSIQCCSTLEQKILRTIASSCQSSGKDVSTMHKVVSNIRSTCLLEGMPWSVEQILLAGTRLFASKLILLENQNPTLYKKVQLNVPIEDLNFALNINPDLNSD